MVSLFYGGGKPDDGAAVGRPQYLSTTTLHKHCKHQGPAEPEGPKGMCARPPDFGSIRGKTYPYRRAILHA